eukprot:725815_1
MIKHGTVTYDSRMFIHKTSYRINHWLSLTQPLRLQKCTSKPSISSTTPDDDVAASKADDDLVLAAIAIPSAIAAASALLVYLILRCYLNLKRKTMEQEMTSNMIVKVYEIDNGDMRKQNNEIAVEAGHDNEVQKHDNNAAFEKEPGLLNLMDDLQY